MSYIEQRSTEPDGSQHSATERCGWWTTEPLLGRVVDGMANRVDRLKSLGNGQVPQVAAMAWHILMGEK